MCGRISTWMVKAVQPEAGGQVAQGAAGGAGAASAVTDYTRLNYKDISNEIQLRSRENVCRLELDEHEYGGLTGSGGAVHGGAAVGQEEHQQHDPHRRRSRRVTTRLSMKIKIAR